MTTSDQTSSTIEIFNVEELTVGALAYFRARLTQAPEDCDHGLSIVLERCRSQEEQARAVAALSFKCDVLWAQLDALYHHCVSPTDVPER